MTPRHRVRIVSTQIDVLDWGPAVSCMLRWGRARESRYVCFSNAHSVVWAVRDRPFREAVNGSDLCASDGAPVTWLVRQLGAPQQPRFNGPDVMWNCLAEAERHELKVFFFGSTPEVLHRLEAHARREFPSLQIAGRLAPPFGAVSVEQDEQHVRLINASGAHLVFVGLGCPRQERWMAAHRGRVGSVMIGVGAAFDFHAGLKLRAPHWMRRWGLEWAHRLAQEPRRLWQRYLVTNAAFLLLGGAQWTYTRLIGSRPAAPHAQDQTVEPVGMEWVNSKLTPGRPGAQGVHESAARRR
jgi:N-acetylglucosaminyldiphosphoundecaprenol N-acetyl-beta-D-mannosaminyltransferase